MKSRNLNRQLWILGCLLVLAAFLLFQPGTTAVHADGSITGTVYRDFDSDGVRDLTEPGIAGITVTAVSDGGSSFTTTTAADGTYMLSTLIGNEARVEFTLPIDGSLDFLHPSVAGGTTVQFVDISGNASNIDAGFINPAQYSVAAPQVVVPRWTRGEPTVAPNSTESVIRSHDYMANSAAAPLTDYATYQQVGTIFGLAHQTQSGVIFGSTYIRRGTAVGPTNTTGAIYKLTGTGAPSVFIDLTTIVSTGANPHPNGAGTNWIVDGVTYPLVGKIGLGDLEISDDETALYVVNLNDRELVIMPLTFDGTGQPVAPAPGDVSTVPIPLPTDCDDTGGDPNEPDATDWRPFGLKFFDGLLYVGGVCTAESMIAGLPVASGFAAVQPFLQYLDAHIYVFDPATSTFDTTPILSIPLDYSREAVNDGYPATNGGTANDGEWLPWSGVWHPGWSQRRGGDFFTNAQPMLSDIEFDGRGFMYIGLRDRFADQAYDAGDPGPNNGPLANQRFGGDFLLACQTAAGGWQLESGVTLATRGCTNGLTGEARLATNPPSNDANYSVPEFFHADQYLVDGNPANGDYHDETGLGTLAMLYGSGELVVTKYDAFQAYENGTNVYDIDNGDRLRGVQLFEANNTSFFSKAGGLGDIELLGGAAPIEVGNRIWQDDDGDGIQDPGEPPIPGVTVSMHDAAGTLLNSAITDANGNYTFSNAQTIGTVVSRIIQSSDDAEQLTNPPDTVTLNSADLDIGFNNVAGNPPHHIGLRFTNIAVPQGATITSAYIQFATDGSGPDNIGNPAIFTIDGQAADNSPTFTTTANDVEGRPRTTLGARVTWSTPTWTGTNFNGPLQRTPNLSGIIQEIVDRAGWATGNAMAFIINDSAQHREAETFDGSGLGIFAPVLVVNYSLPNPADYVALQYRSDYELRVNVNQAGLNGMSVSPPDADATAFGDIRDSDGQTHLGGYVSVNFTTGGPGSNNHSFDFGFAPVTSLGDFLWDDTDHDGYYDPPVQVGDTVWYDLNSNGLQDAGEPGVIDITVELHRGTDPDCTAPPLAFTRTGPDGRYLFDNLAPGDYFICFDLTTLPPGFVATTPNVGGDDTIDSDADPVTGRTANTGPLAAGAQNLTLDMGLVNTVAGTVSIGDWVWYDVNGNGRQDAGEIGVPGVTVDLFTLGQSCADTPVGTQSTDINGQYLFAGLPAGNYFVCFDLATIPPGYMPTTANNQADDSVDSDADTNGQTLPTGSLATGQFNYTLDMGIVSADNVTIGDIVWYDDNADGLQDAGEGGASGIGVQLYAAGDVCGVDIPLMVTTTGGDGSYLFTGLASGDYFVCFDLTTIPAGFEVTAQNVGGDDTIDSDADPTTGATAVTGVIPPGGADITLDMGIRQTDPGTVSVGDRVWYDDDQDGVQGAGESGVPGVTVYLHPAADPDCATPPVATTTTDDQGSYLFTLQPSGDYFVCFDLTTIPGGYMVTEPDRGGNDGADSDADPTTGQTPPTGLIPPGLSNQTLDMGVYPPTHEVRLSGVTVQLYAGAQICDGTSFLAEVTTDENGNYLFAGLPGGDYYVHIPASNFAPGGPLEYMFATLFTGPDPNVPDNTDNNAQEVTAGACTGGLSTNPVTLAITTEPLNDGRTDPNTPDNSSNLTVDNGVYEPLCIGDLVWFDADDDGTVNGTEYGINGILVELYLDDGDGIFEPGAGDALADSMTTATVAGQDGSYSFCSIIEGSYWVHIPVTEFEPGDPLYLFGSSTAVTDPAVTILEDDNNGDDGGDAAANGVTALTAVTLTRRNEPTTEDYDINDNGRRDASTNQTVDLGLTAELDYGDLPDTYDNTIFGDNGPRHPDTGLYLGNLWDNDNDGQESIGTDGDDNDGNDDEDGIVIPTGNGAGTWGDGTAEIDIIVSGGSGCVLGWTDYNLDNDFADEVFDGVGNVPELMFVQFLPTGTNPVTFSTPQSTAGAGTFIYPATLNMRYRIFPANDPLFTAVGLSTDGNGCPTGTTVEMASITVEAASGGEVEDYQQDFSPTAVTLRDIQASLAAAPLMMMVFGVVLLLLLVLTGSGIFLRSRQRSAKV